MANPCEYWLMIAVVVGGILLSSQEAEAQYCTRTAYRSQAYTAYRSHPSVYHYACGWWDWGRCRGTRYHRQAYTAYRHQSYRTCCSGYGYSSCHALCWGSTSCPNGGTCRRPNYCSCRTGWSGYRCTTDVNECATGRHRCHSRANCHNTHGSYTCSCYTGYTGNGFSCSDVNECTRGTDRCHLHATCRNTQGSYTCSCNTGYTGNGFTCTDVNECTRGTDRCHPHATCRNTQGSYTCSCNSGYTGDGFSCSDINECLTNNGGCQHNCHNSVGSYSCSCNNGYRLNSDGHACEDINECLSDNGGCHHNCHNSVGSYSCSCNNGYQLNSDGHTCEVPPLPPSNLQVSGIGNRTATLTWQASVVTFLNSLTAVSSYQVMATQEQFANVSDIYVDVDANTTTYTFPQTLEEYTVYTCTVEARNAFGLGNATHPVTLRTLQSAPSSPPQSVSGVAQSTAVLFFTWSPPPPVDINGIILYYEVDLEEMETGQRWTFIALGADLRLGSLHPYFTYRCKVAAHTVGRGPFSDPFQLKTLETSPTAPPSNFSVISVNSTTMTLSWDPPPFDQINGYIRHYNVVVTERETASEFQEQPTNTQVTLQSLHPYYTYICRVAAVTTGPGPYTGNLTIQLPEDAPSEAPPNLSGHAVNSTTIALMWDTIAVENRNGIIRHYLVSVLEVETGGVHVYTCVAIHLNISGLHPHYTYTCMVAAVTNRVGPFSQNVSIITPQGVPSGPPLNFFIEATTSRTLYFSWEPPLLEQQNGVIVGYTVNIVPDDNSMMFQLYSDEHATNLSAKIFKPYTVYRCAVAAFTTPGTGPYSDEVVILTPEDIPTNPMNTTLARVIGSPTKLYIQWKPPEEPNGIIVAYSIYCKVMVVNDVQQILGSVSGSGSSESIPITASSGLLMSEEVNGLGDISDYAISVVTKGTELKAFVENLTPFTNYECFITANTSAGEGSSSRIVTATTDESAPHDAPSQFSVLVLNSTAVYLNWSSPHLPYGVIISYTLVYNESQSGMQIIPIPGNKTTNYTVQGLNEHTVYTFIVYASTRIGAGPSSEATAQTDEYYPSSPPTEVQVTYVGKREATFTWQPPVFEDQNGVILYYQLVVSQTQFEIPDITVDANTTSRTLTNLEEHVEYTVVVAAATHIGVGPFSSAVNFTTLQDVPSAPPQYAVGVANSPTQVMLSWSPPPRIDINGDLQYYAVRVTEVETGRRWTFYAVNTFITVGGLHPYFNYRCQVAAHNVFGSGPFTNPFYVQTQETAPTAPPSTPQLTNFTSQSFSLTWQPPPFEEINGDIRQYTLSIVELETGWKFEVTTNDTQITINSLHPFYNYLSRIRAETTQPGPYSDEISVHLLEQVPSGPPQNLTGIAINSTAIALSWNAPRFENQNGVIRHYIVNVTEHQTGTTFGTVTTQMAIIFSSLHPYYTYVCTVYAVTIGAGPGAEPVSVTTMEDIPSGVPRDLVAVVISSSAVKLSWQPLLSEQQNGRIIQYVVNMTNIETGEGFELVSALNQLTVHSLHPHWTYIFIVSAETSVGVGPPSLAMTATTLEDAPTLAPQDVVATATDSRTLLMSWVLPPFEHQNGIIREYRVNITERETGRTYYLTTAATSLTVPSLHPFYTYDCKVAAFTIAQGPYSEKLSITMPEDVPSSAPRMLKAVAASSTTIVLTWEAPPPEDLNGLLLGYSINITKLQTGERQELFSNSTMLTVYNLQPYTVYTCVSAAVTNVGHGPFGDAIQSETLEAAPASPPQNVTIISIDSRNVHLSWSLPLPEHQNGLIRKCYINITEVDTGMKFQKTSFGTSLTVSSLHPFFTYSFSVAAYTVDLGPFTEPAVLQMPQDAPTSPPSNCTAVALSSRSVLLKWDAPPVEEQNGIITGYIVNITELETGQVSAIFTESHNLTLYSLQPFTTYGFLVSALTVAGRGPTTHFLFVTTQEEASIGRPINATVLFVGPTSIGISWDHPPEDTHYGIIREYQITYTELETGAVFNTSTESETTQVTVDSLHPFYTYMFFIVPVTVDVGTNHTELTIQTEEAAPSQPPTNVQVPVINPRQVELVWAPPPMDKQNGIIRRYIINVTSVDDGEELITYSQTTSTLVQNLYPFTTYFCSVSAETVAPGPFSPPIVIQTPEDAPTVPPENLIATALGSRTLHITWQPPVEEERNGIIRRYVINITELDSGNEYQLENVTTEITVQNLHPFYRYSYSVAAETVALGPFTPGSIIEMPEDAPSAAPDNITATNITAFSLLLSWNPPPIEHQNGIIREYVVNATEENTGKEFYITTRSPSTEFQLQFLHPYYTYTLAVAAVTTAIGPFSYSVQAVASTASPSSEPRNFMVVNVTSTTIHFSWELPLSEDQNGVITGYTLNVTSLETGESKQIFTKSTVYALYSVSPYTLYTAAIAAQTNAGIGPFSAVTPVLTLEAEPSDTPHAVRLTAVTSTSVDLSWSPPPTEHHNGVIRQYTVRVVVQDTGNIYSTAQLSITVGDLHPYYTYNFSVSAVTVAPGPYSEPLVVQTLPDIPVGSPEITAATSVDPMTVQVSWNPPRLDEQNGIIIYYLVNITTTHPHAGESFQQTCTLLSCNITHLHPYQTYHFAVSAVTIGPGPYSEIYTVTTLEAAPSTPPQNFTVKVLSSTDVFLRWFPPLLDQQNGEIRSYHVRQYETSTGILTNHTQEGNHTELVVGSLHAHYQYQFTIAAETVQLGPFSNPVTVTTLESAPSDAPSNLTSMTINSTSVHLSWLPPDEDQHNGDIRHYNIRIVELHSGREFQLNSTNDTTIYTGLHPAYTYYFTVAAVTVEIGPYSDSAIATMPEDVPTASPQNIQAMTVNSSTVLITWLPPIPEHWNGIITAYIVNVFLEDNETLAQQYTTSSLRVTLVGLHPFSTYVVAAAAETVVGRGPFSSGIRIHTPEDAPNASPQNLRQVAIAATSVTLNWQPPPEEARNGLIRLYYVFVTELETGRSFELNTTKTIYLVENLHPYYTYNFSVAAVTVAAGIISDSITLQTSEAVPSGPPRNLATTSVTSRSISLTWDPPTAVNQNGIIRTYIIRVTVLESGENIQLMSNSTEIDLEMLHPYYTYSFVISAVTIGPGPSSSAYNVTTEEEVPGGSPKNFTADVRSSTQILLMWQPPPSEIQNGHIRLYKISVFEVQTDTNYSYTLHNQPSENSALQVESLHPYYQYMCSVSAFTIGPGPYTSPLTVWTFEDAPSGPPEALSAIALGPRVIQIRWNQPLPEKQNGFIQSYIVNITMSETGQDIQLTTNNTTVTAEGLHPYYNYHISVAAVTIAIGPYTKIYSLQTPQDVPSGTPTNVQGIAISSTSIRLTWEPPRPADQNGVIQAYNITITEVVTGRMMYFRQGGMNFLFTVNSLHPYYTYQCSIAAETIGLGPAANISVTTHQGVPGNAPQNITIVLLDATSAAIYWDLPPFEDRNGVIKLYRVFVVEVHTARVIEQFRTENTSIVLQELQPFHVYQFIIAASTVAGLGPFSNPSFFQMPESAPGASVLNFTVEVVSATRVELSWLPPDPQQWNGRITNYTVVYELVGPVEITSDNLSLPIMTKAIPTQGNSLVNNADPRLAGIPLQPEVAVVNGLQEQHLYKFSVFIANAAGRSEMSMTVIQAMPGAEPSGTPNAIKVHILSSTSIEVRWLPPDFLDQNGIITGYTVILTNMATGFSHEYNASGNVTIQHIKGLQKYTWYYIRIAASTVHGRGPLSNMTVFQTYEDSPGPVKNVTVEQRQGSDNITAVLSWQPPDEPNGIITQYQVLYAGYNGTQLIDGPHLNETSSQTLQLEIPGVIHGLTYQFKIHACTRVGCGNYSTCVSVVVPTIPPSTGSPTNVGGNTTDVQLPVGSTGTQAAISVVAVIGWLLLLGVVLYAVLYLYRYKRRKRKYKVEGTEMHVLNPTFADASTAPGNVCESTENFQVESKCAVDELSAVSTLKKSAADEGSGCKDASD